MSVGKKDVRAWLTESEQAALKEICDMDDADINEWASAALSEIIRVKCHGAIQLVRRLEKRGISRFFADYAADQPPTD